MARSRRMVPGSCAQWRALRARLRLRCEREASVPANQGATTLELPELAKRPQH